MIRSPRVASDMLDPGSGKVRKTSDLRSDMPPLPSREGIARAPSKELKRLLKQRGCSFRSQAPVFELRSMISSLIDESEVQLRHPAEAQQASSATQPPPVTEATNVPSVASSVTNPVIETCEKLAAILEKMRMADQQLDRDFFAQVAGAYVDGIRAGFLLGAKTLPKEPASTLETFRAPPKAALSYAAVARREGQNWSQIPKASVANLRDRQRSDKKSALANLAKIGAGGRDPERTRIWEPEFRSYNQVPVDRLKFKTELEQALHRICGSSRCIERCSNRLDRGGFLIQISEPAWSKLSDLNQDAVALETLGTWKRLPPPSGPSGPSVVIENVPEISTDELIEDLVWKNCSVIGLRPEEIQKMIKGATRLKRRLPDGSWGEGRGIRLFAEHDLLEILINQGGCFVNLSARYCRRFEPVSYLCMKCGCVGHHKAVDCPNPPLCSYCKQSHLSSECPSRKASEQPSAQSAPLERNRVSSWGSDVEEEDAAMAVDAAPHPVQQTSPLMQHGEQ